MKRIAIILIAAIISLSGTMLANAITVDDCFKKFSSAPNAKYVKVNSFLMTIAKMSVGNDPEAALIKKFDSMRVITLENCSETVKKQFANFMTSGSLDDMEEFVSANDDGNKVKILIKTKNDLIRKMLVVCYGAKDCCLVEINGKFSIDDIEDVANSQMPKHDDR